MYTDTPDKEEVDWIAHRVRNIYDYDKLKDCDLDYLHNLECGIEARMHIFESSFPPEEGIEGPLRAALHDNPNEDKMALSEAERLRLEFLKEEVRREIRRAKGHRIDNRREHRSKIANAVADVISSSANLIPWR